MDFWNNAFTYSPYDEMKPNAARAALNHWLAFSSIVSCFSILFRFPTGRFQKLGLTIWQIWGVIGTTTAPTAFLSVQFTGGTYEP